MSHLDQAAVICWEETKVVVICLCFQKGRQAILNRLEAVSAFRKMYVPKFTDCTIIAQHANAPYKQRMIAFDEVLFDVGKKLPRAPRCTMLF